jgi:hypothetical protein
MMLKGAKEQNRPAGVTGNAVMVAQIATGEIDDITPDDSKDLL